MVGRECCSAINCRNSRKYTSTSLFRVPKDPIRSKQWVTNCGREDLLSKDPIYLYDNISFCAAHFEDSQFINSNKNRLIWNAVPTLFSESSDVGLIESTTSKNNPSPVENVKTEKDLNATWLNNQKPIKIICKPSILMRKLKAVVKDDCQSSPKHTTTKDTINPDGKVELLTKLVSKKDNFQSRPSIKLMEGKSTLNPSEMVQVKLGIPKNKFIILKNGKLGLNLSNYKITNSTNKTFKRVILKRNLNALNANECQSTVQESGNKSLAKCTETNDEDPTDDVDKEEREDQSSPRCNDTKSVTSPANEVEIRESGCQSSTKSIDTKDMKIPTDEVDKEEKETQDIKTGIIANPTNDVVKKKSENKSSAKCTETDDKDPADDVDKEEIEDQSSPRCNETKGVKNPANKVEIEEIECQSSANGFESKGTTNHTGKTDSPTAQQIIDCQSSSPINEEQPQLHPPENNSLIITSESPQQRKKVKPSGIQISFLKNSKMTNKRTIKPTSLKRKFDASKESECRSSAKKTKGIKKFSDKVDIQDNLGPKIVDCYSLLKNTKNKSIQSLANQENPVKLVPPKSECQSSILLPSVKRMENKRTSDPTEKVQTEISSPENDSLLLNDEFSLYKKKVEAFKNKILSPQFKPDIVKPTVRGNFSQESERQSSVDLKHIVSRKGISIPIGKVNQVKQDLQNFECRPSVNYIKRDLNPTDNIQYKSSPPENYSIIIKSELTKCKEKVRAYEKIIDGLKNEHKSESRKLRKVIKELRRRIRRKDFLIKKLRRERSELKNCTTSVVKSKSKVTFRRDRHFIEQTLSKYMGKEALNIVMSQMKPPSTNYGSRWDDEIKMFALNILHSSPKAYRILCSYLHLPTTRTLQRFIQGVDLLASSGLKINGTSDAAGNNEDNTEPGQSSNVQANGEDFADPETVPFMVVAKNEDIVDPGTVSSIVEANSVDIANSGTVSASVGADYEMLTDTEMVSVVEGDYEVLTDPEIISSVVEIGSEDTFVGSLIPQATGEEEEDTAQTEEIIYYITGTDQECEVITGDYIPAQD